MSKKEKNNIDFLSSWFIVIGVVFVFLSSVILLAIFYPTIMQEISYVLYSKGRNNTQVVISQESNIYLELADDPSGVELIIPVDNSFGIIIPKINANAPIVGDVDSQNPDVYQVALSKGVAHASGTVYPGTNGNTFLFAHSSDNFYNANRYNSVFYLLHKLIEEDEIYISYQGDIYRYIVNSKRIVDPDKVEYLFADKDESNNKLTLMTCWPPGTTLKRLIIEADLAENVDTGDENK